MGKKVKLEIILTEEDIAFMEKPKTLGKVIALFNHKGFRYWLTGIIETKEIIKGENSKES